MYIMNENAYIFNCKDESPRDLMILTIMNNMFHKYILFHQDYMLPSHYTTLQKFGIISVSWSTRGNTATQMTIFSRLPHRIF